MPSQIVGCSPHYIRTVSEQAKRHVAFDARQAADFPGLMIVVNTNSFVFIERSTTHRAITFL